MQAVLFYGYNLSDPEEDRWNIKEEEYDVFQAPWLVSGDTQSGRLISMNGAILEGADIDLADVLPLDYDGLVERHCGVRILTYGNSNKLYYGIGLVGSVYVADDWAPAPVAPGSNIDSHEPLAKALRALGMTPEAPHPSWILAPSEL
jgi:hypothetical protein